MILTLTISPSINRLAWLDTELKRGGVFRLPMVEDMAGGKGINMPRALHYAKEKTFALYPALGSGEFARLLEVSGILHEAINTTNEAHIDLTLAKPDGTTTKLNSPGMTLTKAHHKRVLEKLIRHAKRATWVVFAGSPPPGVPRDFYIQCIGAVYSVNPNIRVALDTSDGPLTEVIRTFPKIRPFLVRPNVCELGQIIDQGDEVLGAAAVEGNYLPVAQAARALNELGISEIFTTLGEAGAALSVKSGDCFATTSPSIVAQSTVGVKDYALAGYIMSHERDDNYQGALTTVVACGAVVTSLPGTTIPYSEQVHPEADRL